MKKLLHINAAPRGSESRTLKVSNAFLESFKDSHNGWIVDELNLFTDEIPSLTKRRIDGKYVVMSGKDLSGDVKESWEEIVFHIERFMSADGYLLSSPMWNFSIPYHLKKYIDVIVQPKYMFRYTDKGVEGLVKGKKMIVCVSRGGDYSAPDAKIYDQQEPYLRTVFGFVGLTDMTFVIAQPMDAGTPELQGRRLEEAIIKAREIAISF